MSALARMLKHRGYSVRGTDSTLSPEVERLRSEGIEVKIGHSGVGLQEGDAVILTDAIDLSTSPEVARSRELGLPLFRRSQALGWLLKPYKVIAVTGTHGKTTTTGMTGAGLIAAGLDPLVVVGASIPEWGGPVREGKGEWAVVEACEAYDSFHDLDPHTVVLTNLELDHTDFHGNWENLKGSVVRFVSKIEGGSFIYYANSLGGSEVAEAIHHDTRIPLTGYVEGPLGIGGTDGPLTHKPLPPLALPGEHNRINAEGAFPACLIADADADLAAQGIASFTGAERRLQLLHDRPITVIDDYAHHPTEIEASLQAIRERYPQGRLVVAFQPHLYSRTADNIPGFAKALDLADVVFLTDIYPAREDPIPGISSARIAELVTQECHYVPSRFLLPRKVAEFANPGDIVVGMGAGNIAEFAPDFIREFDRKSSHQIAHPESLSILVLAGGDSSEREVSILSGRAIHVALQELGFKSKLVDLTELALSKGDLSILIGENRPDLAFLATHGTHAEDGALQGLLEHFHIPYTGSGIQASAIAMDKNLTKQILAANDIRVPKGKLIQSPSEGAELTAPMVVKPNQEGSTVGLTFVEQTSELPKAIERALYYGGACLVEEWVRGLEISVPVLGNRALPPVEIVPNAGAYDFAAKYTPGATNEIAPARLPDNVLERAQETAIRCHTLLGCKGATRTDMIESDRELVVLEINTLPGMTGTSLLPNSARAAGMSFNELVKWLVVDALERNGAKA
jgi:D-alanine--D-alanine ligase